MGKTILVLIFIFSFTFAFSQTGPGGVGTTDGSSNLSLWLRGDIGVEEASADPAEDGDEVLFWRDQSGNNYHAEKITSFQDPPNAYDGPTYESDPGEGNGQPVLTFNGSDEGMFVDSFDETSQQFNDELCPIDEITVFVFGQNESTGGWRTLISTGSGEMDGDGHGIFEDSGGDDPMGLYVYNWGWGDAPYADDPSYRISIDYDTSIEDIWCMILDPDSSSPRQFHAYKSEASTTSLDFPETGEPNTIRYLTLNNFPNVEGQNNDITIGTAVGTSGVYADDDYDYFLQGHIGEVIIFDRALNDAERIIVANHLSAKYNEPLALNDKYAGDTSGNGEYDFDVIGIGQESNGSHILSRAAGLVLDDYLFLADDGDYILAGHDGSDNEVVDSDLPAPVLFRWSRIWYLDRTDGADTGNGNFKIGFDYSEGEVGGLPEGPSTNYKLLWRSGTSGTFSVVPTAGVSYSGDEVTFEVADGNLSNGYYTIGTINWHESPLPIILSSFTASMSQNTPQLQWITQSETDNMGWNIYRSPSQYLIQAALINLGSIIPGQGTTTQPTNYSYIDETPVINGNTYWYWIESIELSGETNMYGPISLTIHFDDNFNEIPPIPEEYGLQQSYPNPFNPDTIIEFILEEDSFYNLSIYNMKGQKIRQLDASYGIADNYYFRLWNGTDDSNKIVPSGVYFYKLQAGDLIQTRKMLFLK